VEERGAIFLKTTIPPSKPGKVCSYPKVLVFCFESAINLSPEKGMEFHVCTSDTNRWYVSGFMFVLFRKTIYRNKLRWNESFQYIHKT
jgi:hypothetical protein